MRRAFLTTPLLCLLLVGCQTAAPDAYCIQGPVSVKKRVAIHEASHTVAALANDIEVTWLKVDFFGRRITGGGTSYISTENDAFAAQISLAGYFSERLFLCLDDIKASSVDFEQVQTRMSEEAFD